MSISLSLVNIIHKAITGSKWLRIVITLMGPVFYFGLVALCIIAARWLDDILHLPKLLPAPLNIFVSVPVLAVGLSLMIWTATLFLRTGGTPVPFNPPPRLVTSGPYARVRNPMLSGVFIFMSGLGLLLGSISLLFILTPLFILVSVLELKLVEEPELEKRLGEAYVEYRQRVPMFLPWCVRKKRSGKQ